MPHNGNAPAQQRCSKSATKRASALRALPTDRGAAEKDRYRMAGGRAAARCGHAGLQRVDGWDGFTFREGVHEGASG